MNSLVVHVLEPEPVAVADASELVDDDGSEERSGPRLTELEQPARKHVQPRRVVPVQPPQLLQGL